MDLNVKGGKNAQMSLLLLPVWENICSLSTTCVWELPWDYEMEWTCSITPVANCWTSIDKDLPEGFMNFSHNKIRQLSSTVLCIAL